MGRLGARTCGRSTLGGCARCCRADGGTCTPETEAATIAGPHREPVRWAQDRHCELATPSVVIPSETTHSASLRARLASEVEGSRPAIPQARSLHFARASLRSG